MMMNMTMIMIITVTVIMLSLLIVSGIMLDSYNTQHYEDITLWLAKLLTLHRVQCWWLVVICRLNQ